MGRVGLEQRFDDRFFGSLVDVGDEIVVLFFRDRNTVEVERRAVDDSCGAASGLDGRIEHWMHMVFPEKKR